MRVLTGAREKIAEALIEGKAIKFEVGDYRLANYKCSRCGEKSTSKRGRRYHKRQLCSNCNE